MTSIAVLIGRGLLSARPAAGTPGSLYYATDTTTLYRDNGTSWDSVEGATGFANPMTAAGDIITGGTAGAPQRLAVGGNGTVLTVVSGAPAWAAGGGGAPTTSQYVLGATDASLANGIVVPGLGASADIQGAAGGGAVSEEYDSTATNLTASPSSPANLDSDTTIKSHLYLNQTDSTERFLLRAWTPGAGVAFDARCHLSLGATAGANSGVYLLVADSGNANRAIVGLAWDPTNNRYTANAYSYASGAYTQIGSTLVGPFRYARMQRTTANVYTVQVSVDGLMWATLGTATLSFTVAQIGYRTGGNPMTAASDWLRTNV